MAALAGVLPSELKASANNSNTLIHPYLIEFFCNRQIKVGQNCYRIIFFDYGSVGRKPFLITCKSAEADSLASPKGLLDMSRGFSPCGAAMGDGNRKVVNCLSII